MRGMNLGGWLVMEQWMTPQLYNGVPDLIDGWNIQLLASNGNWLSAHNPRTVRAPQTLTPKPMPSGFSFLFHEATSGGRAGGNPNTLHITPARYTVPPSTSHSLGAASF